MAETLSAGPADDMHRGGWVSGSTWVWQTRPDPRRRRMVMPRLPTRVGRIGAAVGLLLTVASCSLVSGPVTGPGTIALSTGFDLGQVGYERSEFFVGWSRAQLRADGAAHRRRQVGRTSGSRGPAAGFKTRFVVYRPTDASKFNGTVVVEWLNVTAGADLADRLGHGAQRVRPRAATRGSACRHRPSASTRSRRSHPPGTARSSHPGDSYSYDIFTEVGRHIRATDSERARRAHAATLDRHRRVAVGEPAGHLHQRGPPAGRTSTTDSWCTAARQAARR